jgi:hypothetical protein
MTPGAILVAKTEHENRTSTGAHEIGSRPLNDQLVVRMDEIPNVDSRSFRGLVT